MSKPEQWQQEQIPEDEQIEIIDLEFPSPDVGGLSGWLSSTLLQWQRSARRWHWQAGFSLALALLLTIFCLLNTASFARVSALFRRPTSLCHPSSFAITARAGWHGLPGGCGVVA